MLIVNINNSNSLDKALKDLKRKVIKTKLVKQLRERCAYVKPSVRKRAIKIKARYKQGLIDSTED